MYIATVEVHAPTTWEEPNNGYPLWKQDFINYGYELLPGLGFEEITLYRDDVTRTWKRTQGPMVMTVTQMVDNAPRSTVWCSWNYLDRVVPPSGCALDAVLWRAILDGFDNNTLLIKYFNEENT